MKDSEDRQLIEPWPTRTMLNQNESKMCETGHCFQPQNKSYPQLLSPESFSWVSRFSDWGGSYLDGQISWHVILMFRINPLNPGQFTHRVYRLPGPIRDNVPVSVSFFLEA